LKARVIHSNGLTGPLENDLLAQPLLQHLQGFLGLSAEDLGEIANHQLGGRLRILGHGSFRIVSIAEKQASSVAGVNAAPIPLAAGIQRSRRKNAPARNRFRAGSTKP
jgi:hypothetical protein